MNTFAQFAVAASVIAFLFGIVSSYPNSVPNSPDVCSKMIPGHGPRPQTTTSPYEIILNKQSVLGGHNLQIVIHGKKGRKFKGFYLQVRDQDGSPIGTLISPDENEAAAHSCFNQKNNAIHHKNNKDKSSITVYWKAPENYVGEVRVLATVLMDFERYWTNVQAPELVSVSNITEKIFMASPSFPEKREEAENAKVTEAYRILDYNPYSPFSPLSSWNGKLSENSSSAEFMLSQPSETSSVALKQERTLFGSANFDFHGGLYSSKLSNPLKPKIPHPIDYIPPFVQHNHHHHNHLNKFPFQPVKGPSSINEQLPPLPHGYGPVKHNPTPVNSIFHKLGLGKSENKEKLPSYVINEKPFGNNLNVPHAENPYPFHYSDPISNDISHTVEGFNAPPEDPLLSHPLPQKYPQLHPHYSQSVYDKGGHYVVNHHYIYPPGGSIEKPPFYPLPHLHPVPAPPQHKPATDPSYPNSGYFPKDILTKLTSYIPNIYNALTHNHLLNFNVDNTIESIWKPSRGVPLPPQFPPPQKLHSLGTGTNPVTVSKNPSKFEMPKYGYLIYNPVRGDPYYVLPAQNEDEFIANHLSTRRKPQINL